MLLLQPQASSTERSRQPSHSKLVCVSVPEWSKGAMTSGRYLLVSKNETAACETLASTKRGSKYDKC
uniref:Uncharacterized protein n=1 Tax=Peronospora matthiolae TaxID=2874970 RepID=A0AAV1U0C5_9STRA